MNVYIYIYIYTHVYKVGLVGRQARDTVSESVRWALEQNRKSERQVTGPATTVVFT